MVLGAGPHLPTKEYIKYSPPPRGANIRSSRFTRVGKKPGSEVINMVTAFLKTASDTSCTIVMQHSLVVYRGISHESMVFTWYKGECVYQVNTGDSWNIPWYTTTGRYITILYHATENSCQHNQCNIHVVQDGKVGCNTVEYTMPFLYRPYHGF